MIYLTYSVASTSSTVRLTWMTVSRYSVEKAVAIWLMRMRMAVGRVVVSTCEKKAPDRALNF